MLRSWRSWRKANAIHECHFCGGRTVLLPPYGGKDVGTSVPSSSDVFVSCGTPTRWFCAQCECWNYRDSQGELLDVWDPSVVPETKRNSHSIVSSGSLAAEDPCVFCKGCLTNQTLVTNLLANYLDGEDESSDADRLAAFPAYKSSLEKRYPLACESCAAKANAWIDAVDENFRQSLLGSWARRPETAAQHDTGSTSRLISKTRSCKWQRWLFYTIQIVTVVELLAVSTRNRYPWCKWLSIIPMLPLVYDPTWQDTISIHKRQAFHVRRDLVLWKRIQYVLWILRSLLVLHAWYDRLHWSTTIVCLFVYFTVGALLIQCMMYGWSTIRVSENVPLHLVSRRVTAQEGESQGSDPLAGMSLCDAQAAPSLDELLVPVPYAGEAMELEDETPRNLHLGPQHLPTQSSGLEELFEKRLALDTPALHKSTWSWTTSHAPVVIISLAMATALVQSILRSD